MKILFNVIKKMTETKKIVNRMKHPLKVIIIAHTICKIIIKEEKKKMNVKSCININSQVKVQVFLKTHQNKDMKNK